MFALLKPTFSLPHRPHQFPLMLHPMAERSPTDTSPARCPLVGVGISQLRQTA